MDSPPAGSILTNRQLNRALLARQHLLVRAPLSAGAMIEHLAGMQSQAPRDPFIGLWTRLVGFAHDELDRLMLEREAVRMTLMRGTIHLVTARDAFALRPVVQTTLRKLFTANATYAPQLEGLDLDQILDAARRLVEEQPMPGKRLGQLLAERWPDRDPVALSYAARYILPLVQITPRGVWGKSQQPTLTTVDAWLGTPIDAERDPDAAIEQYLAAFGPATVADIQAWSGMTGLREHVERMRPRLVSYRDERARELFDIPGGLFPAPGVDAPFRFLPGFENALLSHADRTRIISYEHRKLLWKATGLVAPTFLRDGYVGGSWKVTTSKAGAVLEITPFGRALAPEQRASAEVEGRELLAFLEPDAANPAIRFNDPE